MKRNNHPKRLKQAAIRLYRDGYTEAEIICNKERLTEVHKLGPEWKSANQTSLNRWIKSAKEEDLDLQIWHLLNRRRRRPNTYTNWQPDGVIILGAYYEPLEDTLYLGPGDGYIPVGTRNPSKIVETDPEWRAWLQDAGRSLKDTDAVGLYVAELSSLGYSLRDIVTLWGKGRTRYPDRDKAPRVQWLIQRIRIVREKPMSYTTIRRILQTYSFGPVAESFKETQMAEIGDLNG